MQLMTGVGGASLLTLRRPVGKEIRHDLARRSGPHCQAGVLGPRAGGQLRTVDSTEIQQAYQAFAGALRAGRFTGPEAGWDASLIAAHVTANNDAIASVAERIAAGQHPSYDNAQVTDDERLREIASAAGTLDNLAALVLQSAARLARAWEQLGPELGQTEVPAKIADSGRIVHDDFIPIRDFIERNATSHLQLHLAQLQALQLATRPRAPEADPPS